VTTRKPTLLLVEHDASMRRTLREMLGPDAYLVVEAASAAEALSLAIDAPRLDLALLDVDVAGGGLDAYVALIGVAPELVGRVVLLTRRSPPPLQREFLGAFPGRALVRPVWPRHLRDALDSVLAGPRRARRHSAARRSAA
jgi:CheY-like chemotaxis protein